MLPDSYKPAVQEFDLPLSARYGGSSNQFNAAPATDSQLPSVEPQFGGAPSSTYDQQSGQLNSMGGQFSDQGSYSDDQMGQFENQAAQGDMIPSNTNEHFDEEYPSLYQDPPVQTSDTGEYQFTPAPEVTDYQYTPAPDGGDYQYTEAPDVDQNDQLLDGDIYLANQDQDPNVVHNSHTHEEVQMVVEEEGPGFFERISNYFAGWGSKDEEALREAMNSPPENPSWEETIQGRKRGQRVLFGLGRSHMVLNMVHCSPQPLFRVESVHCSVFIQRLLSWGDGMAIIALFLVLTLSLTLFHFQLIITYPCLCVCTGKNIRVSVGLFYVECPDS